MIKHQNIWIFSENGHIIKKMFKKLEYEQIS